MLGIAPIVYPSIRRGGPGGADLMVIDQSRAMSATRPSKRTGDEFCAVVMRTRLPVQVTAAHAEVPIGRIRRGLSRAFGVRVRCGPDADGSEQSARVPARTWRSYSQALRIGSPEVSLHRCLRPPTTPQGVQTDETTSHEEVTTTAGACPVVAQTQRDRGHAHVTNHEPSKSRSRTTGANRAMTIMAAAEPNTNNTIRNRATKPSLEHPPVLRTPALRW
jgi:hypothetical protein